MIFKAIALFHHVPSASHHLPQVPRALELLEYQMMQHMLWHFSLSEPLEVAFPTLIVSVCLPQCAASYLLPTAVPSLPSFSLPLSQAYKGSCAPCAKEKPHCRWHTSQSSCSCLVHG